MTAQLVGILNITPDSFSDGGKYNNQKAALKQTETLITEGADIIDIGAESTRPNAQLITADEEWNRLKNVLPNIIALTHQHQKLISLDTRNAITAQKALDLGVDIINDVSGLEDPNMGQVISSYNKPIIINHNLGLPASPDITLSNNEDIIKVIKDWGKDKISSLENQYNIPKKNIVFDVGIGFGKTPQQSLEIINNITSFKKLGTKIYVGHSRKSFLNLYQPNSILAKDLLTAYFASKIAADIDYIRIHNITLTKEFTSCFHHNNTGNIAPTQE